MCAALKEPEMVKEEKTVKEEYVFVASEVMPEEVVDLLKYQGITDFTRVGINTALAVRLPEDLVFLKQLDEYLSNPDNHSERLANFIQGAVRAWQCYDNAGEGKKTFTEYVNMHIRIQLQGQRWPGIPVKSRDAVNLSGNAFQRRRTDEVELEVRIDATEEAYYRHTDYVSGSAYLNVTIEDIREYVGRDVSLRDISESELADLLYDRAREAHYDGDVEYEQYETYDTEYADHIGYNEDSMEFSTEGAADELYSFLQRYIEENGDGDDE